MTHLPHTTSANRPQRRLPIPPADPHQHARAIADAVDATWHRAHGTGDLDVPVSVVAGVSLIAPTDGDRDQVTESLLGLDTEAFTGVMRTQWKAFVNARPDLVVPAWPLISVWYGDHRTGEHNARAARQVADAAIRAGQLLLTGTERRADTDLFGALLTALRSSTDRGVRGQFYTPADVSTLIASLLGTPVEGQAVHEPAAGTGGMLRAVAQAMRDAGHDPAAVSWVAVDTDPLAVACLAVNTVLWGLGHHVSLAVGNALTDEALARAEAQRREVVDLAARVRRAKAAITATRDAYAMLKAGEYPLQRP